MPQHSAQRRESGTRVATVQLFSITGGESSESTAASSVTDERRSAMPVPNPVRYAVAAMWVLLALAVLRTILTIAFKDDLIDAWLENRPGSRGLPREVAADGAPAYVG